MSDEEDVTDPKPASAKNKGKAKETSSSEMPALKVTLPEPAELGMDASGKEVCEHIFYGRYATVCFCKDCGAMFQFCTNSDDE